MTEPSADPLRNHRRTFLYASGLLVAVVLIFVAVGRHPGQPGTTTTWPPVGRFDGDVYRVVQEQRDPFLTSLAKVLNVMGSGIVTIPLRIVVALYLALRRRWRTFAAWVLTWVAAEAMLTVGKTWYMRARPPAPLVVTTGFSFPSGHAVAGAAIAVALVLIAMPAGSRRRKWEILATLAAFLMALSRVYLNAHWLADVIAGVLLGTGIALGSFAVVTEIRDLAEAGRRRRSIVEPPMP